MRELPSRTVLRQVIEGISAALFPTHYGHPDNSVTLSPCEHVQYAWLPYLEAAERCFSSSNAEAILQLPRHID